MVIYDLDTKEMMENLDNEKLSDNSSNNKLNSVDTNIITTSPEEVFQGVVKNELENNNDVIVKDKKKDFITDKINEHLIQNSITLDIHDIEKSFITIKPESDLPQNTNFENILREVKDY